MSIVDLMRKAMAAMPQGYPEPMGYWEDWLPLGRGGDRRRFNSVDEYVAEHRVWLAMNRHEREAHLAEREARLSRVDGDTSK
jgi:hypothetical protein